MARAQRDSGGDALGGLDTRRSYTRRTVAALLATGLLGCTTPAAPDDAATPEDGAIETDASSATDASVPPAPAIADCTSAPTDGLGPLRPRCQLLVDEDGRVVLLRGVNARVRGLFDVSFDDGRTALEEIPDFTDDDARAMRAMGLDLLRLPISWSAIEPADASPRAYVESYVARLRAILDICRAHGIYVLVDWHQDAYSKEIGEDGAPLWAISPAPTMLLEGPLEDLGTRRGSAQVLAAFATFFGDDAPGPALRDRLAEVAAFLADALRGDPSVVGFEIYNEPVASDAQTRRLNERVAAAIREADPTRLSFFEPPSVPRNFTDRAALATSPFTVPGGVYAPHSYTLSFNGTEAQRMSFTRDSLRTSHANAQREAASWGTPLLIGEWGYDPAGTRAADYYAMQISLMDELAESWALWVWKEQSQGSWGVFDYDADADAWTERPLVVNAITRPRPERIAGWPQEIGFDASSGTLTLRYRGEAAITAPSTIYLPARAPTSFVVSCDDEVLSGIARDDASGLIEVACVGEGEHVVRITGLDGL